MSTQPDLVRSGARFGVAAASTATLILLAFVLIPLGRLVIASPGHCAV